MATGPNFSVDLNTRVSNLELAVFGGGSPQNIGTPSPAGGSIETEAASGAIGIVAGLSLLAGTGALAMTLAVPAVQDNGKTLQILSTTANLHTITTPAAALDGTYSVATFGGNVDDCLTLRAVSGVWVVTGVKNITFTV